MKLMNKIAVLILIMLISKSACGQQTVRKVLNPEKVVLYSYIKVFQMVDSVMYADDFYDTVRIQFTDSLVIYHLPVRLINQNTKKGAPDKIRFDYFVFKKGDNSGLLFRDTADVNFPHSRDVDSITSSRGYANIVQLKNVRFFSSAKGAGNAVTETYLPLVKRSEFTFDTLKLTYDSTLMNSNYVLGPSLDSIKQSKLIGYVYSFKKYYSPTYRLNMPPRHISFKFDRLAYTHDDRKLADRLRILYQKYQDELR